MSSIIHTVPASPVRASDMRLWKCSGADEMPKGNLLKPNGVMKREDSGARVFAKIPSSRLALRTALHPPVGPISDQRPGEDVSLSSHSY